MMPTPRTLLLCMLLPLAACASGESMYAVRVPVPVHAGTPRDAVALALERSNDGDAHAWEEAGRRALRAGLSVPASFRERVRFPYDEPHAIAYRFPLRRGQSLHVSVDRLEGSDTVFADVFEVVTEDIYRHVYSPGVTERSFDVVARADAQYVLRLQPAPGAASTLDVAVAGAARRVLFPLPGFDAGAIQSWFGDQRDGGARSHEGVDIFAPRGTPVIAAAGGRVTSVRPTPVGGNVIWVDDDDGTFSYYYAHLDERLVDEGQYVSAGDTIGRVGNTGNAITVSPHLHFSVYLPGRIAIDPAPLLDSNTEPLGQPADASAPGHWARTTGDAIRLRASPTLAGAVVGELREHTRVFVLGTIGAWHRVVLTDGRSGFIAARYTSRAN